MATSQQHQCTSAAGLWLPLTNGLPSSLTKGNDIPRLSPSSAPLLLGAGVLLRLLLPPRAPRPVAAAASGCADSAPRLPDWYAARMPCSWSCSPSRGSSNVSSAATAAARVARSFSDALEGGGRGAAAVAAALRLLLAAGGRPAAAAAGVTAAREVSCCSSPCRGKGDSRLRISWGCYYERLAHELEGTGRWLTAPTAPSDTCIITAVHAVMTSQGPAQ